MNSIPRGIEVLVKKASVDPDFRDLLLERRSRAADAIGLTLAPAESQMLDAVPAAQLEVIIARTTVPPSRRQAFLGTAAAIMLAALGAAGCDELVPVTGIAPDRPQAKPGTEKPAAKPATAQPAPEAATPATKGIRPDRPKPRTDAPTRGTRPDRP